MKHDSEALPIETKKPKSSLGVGVKCRGECDAAEYNLGFVGGSPYKNGAVRCSVCEIYLKSDYDVCPCCNFKLRTKSPHSQIEKRTPEGDKAFHSFGLAFIELKNGINSLPKWFEYHDLGVARTKILITNIRLVNAFLVDIAKYKRQRPDRIDDKHNKIEKLIDKLKSLLPNY